VVPAERPPLKLDGPFWPDGQILHEHLMSAESTLRLTSANAVTSRAAGHSSS
jgi:hypothetical protein